MGECRRCRLFSRRRHQSYPNTSNLLTVKKYDGGNWVSVGVPGFPSGIFDNFHIAIGFNNVPVVMYSSGGIYVQSFGNLVTLPLRLTEFNGHIANADVRLEWKTESEENTREFIVERSTNGRHYSTVGSVTAANSHGSHQYSFADRNVAQLGATEIYYRLKQVDMDDQSMYSRVLVLPVEPVSKVVCYPNPVTSETSITITLNRAEKVQTRLINI